MLRTRYTDVLITITTASLEERLIGSSSIYSEEPHPITGKTIQGWGWDEMTWPRMGSLDSYANVPTLWDPIVSGLDESFFQSGIGDNNDLLLTNIEELYLAPVSGDSASTNLIWTPKINHGWYYVFDQENYLYSDSYQTQQLLVSGDSRFCTLRYKPKIGVPIRVCTWERDGGNLRYEASQEFRQRVELTVSGVEPEFWVIENPSGLLPTLELNGVWEETVGEWLSLVSGYLETPEDIFTLEEIGISDGTADQEKTTRFFPIYEDLISGLAMDIWTYADPARPISWTIIPTLSGFSGPVHEVKVDPDNGHILFGDGQDGIIPSAGSRIVAAYKKGIVATYEPERTTDLLLAPTAEVNPVQTGAKEGFVQVTTSFSGAARVVLSADLPEGDNSYLISLGNNVGKILATVYDANNIPLDSQIVTFRLIAPETGTFGGISTETVANTNINGVATAIYNSPLTIQDVGRASAQVLHNGADTLLTVTGIVDPGSTNALYTYKVHTYDTALGIAEDAVSGYYADFFATETISGATATELWEEAHRDANEFLLPVTYEAGNLSKGKKTILLTTSDPTVIDPHTGHVRGSSPYPFAPLYPDIIENIGTSAMPVTRLTFEDILLPMPPTDGTKAYFVVGNSKTRVQAFVINKQTGATVYSNIITIQITIPTAVNGTYFANALNDIPSGLMNSVRNIDDLSDGQINATSGIDDFWIDYLDECSGGEEYVTWFRRTRRGDTIGLTIAGYPLLTWTASSGDLPGRIPLGFRLKSTGITLASMLDQITYIDPNDNLPSGYWPEEWYDEG